MDTAHLKAFLKIADSASISRAAESLGIAQPSLSQQLLRLEDEIGFSLFERTARGVTLTEAGHVFRERARQILHATEQAVADARHLRADARGQVVLAMPPSLMRVVGARLVEELARQAPSVRLRLVEAYSGAARGWLETEKIDLGVLYEVHPLRHLATRTLASEELVLAGPSGRFAADAKVEIAALAAEPLVLPGPQHGLRQLLDRDAARLGLTLQIAHEIDSLDTTISLVEHAAALTVLPLCAAAGAREKGWISTASIGDPPLRRTLTLARNPSHVLTHASIMVEGLLCRVMADCASAGLWRADANGE
ncbi:LysR family nitrogen assimilation transcriptional regulator [Novosphingobium sp. PhB165]|uniref:LysR family transcriptional regulator n=1 Tax=Novosphingobium sp. PhB165 TaxID=2485105 RepID=UPI00104A50CE|nr:LysR family transcriptional regulator [Novosphingobium sp. PhB165]TCM15409.1 LysR family nitrogen assimilation transcriptional regulator [Novosphingobium sp. PhB165]